MVAITVRIDDAAAARLDELAIRLGRNREEVAAAAVSDYLVLQSWQLDEIEAALAEADAGDLRDGSEADALVAKFEALSGRRP